MYGAEGRSLIAMGDPVGDRAEGSAPCSGGQGAGRQRRRPGDLHHASPAWLTEYLDIGLTPIKLGEEARVRLPDFSLEGGKRRNLRQGHSKALREGLSFEIVQPPQSDALMAELRADLRRLADPARRPREGLLAGPVRPGHPAARSDRPGPPGRRHRRLRQRPARRRGRGLRRPDAPRARRAARGDGLPVRRDHQLGQGPGLPVVQPRHGAADRHGPAPARAAVAQDRRPGRRRGGRFYGFTGLRAFKAKFDPVWTPRYLAAPPLALPAALIDVARLISTAADGARPCLGPPAERIAS